MDVYGRNPTALEGEYFRHSVWGWHLPARLVTTLCPDEASPCGGWYCNDGDGLDAAQAAALAAKLEKLQASGDVEAYCAYLDVRCEPGNVMTKLVASLKAAGLEVRHNEPRLEPRDMAEFVAFLKASGGFSIW
jgi:hypothetical protein